ncbi:GNAT family N-acetyltransferase [Gloeocapsopsis dulcis]|uniref:GCN5-related N-acetyltransferase n=1 Tax=Gloeocapsopsis dulcis AAB1 = 1H9 TaxID=1433147 RepID=A0A6N8FQI3_9CHRO|nr:GNAT family N-acetyltransferase [Gloeocapsopsis dulcis]MUL35301.1 GCN5-related N-acetyltransferase [Gloeocapsopsis dulcis AAB1 = 1H9]WNN90497.1 GNAT family N-acetyltransferase [Gloeocapsopsis dulcis]
MSLYRFQKSFADPTLSERLFTLLETVFPGLDLSNLAKSTRAMGAPWETASTPFIRFDDDIAIAHVGVLEIPLQIMGESVTVGGIHAVATHPEYRRRGYYREIMREVLDYCDRRYETLVLTTSQPELYEPFGFRVVEEHKFIKQCDAKGNGDRLQLLNLSDSNDVKLLHRLLKTRIPVSNVVGVLPQQEKALFCVNEATRPLYYAEDLNVIICMEIEDTQLKLFDVVGTNIPTLDALLAQIPQLIKEIIVYFSPDRLNSTFQAIPHVLDEALLMVRGKFAAEGDLFMLPRSARC